jgi:hypothetical protein
MGAGAVVSVIAALLPAVAQVVKVFYGTKVVEEVVDVKKPVATGSDDDARVDELVQLHTHTSGPGK